jgi:putative transposase
LVPRRLIYYHLNKKDSYSSNEESILTHYIKEIFRKSRNNYGTRKIKVKLDDLGYQVSRRRISRIMKENSLVLNYAVAQYKVHSSKCNE